MLLEYLAGLIALIFNSLTFFKDDGSDAGKVAFLIPATVKIIFAGFKLPLYGFRVKDGHVDTLSMISISEANAITTTCFVFFCAGSIGIPCIVPDFDLLATVGKVVCFVRMIRYGPF